MNTSLALCASVTIGFAALFIPVSVQAGQPVNAPSGKEIKIAPEEPSFQLQPIFTRLARTSDKITISTTFRGSRDVELQEADHLNSWGFDAELVVPFLKRFQLRLNVPIHTEGSADLLTIPILDDKGRRVGTQPHDRVHLDGNGGVFDFASAQLEYQFLTEEQSGINMTASVGYAKRLDWLQTDRKVSGKFNHKGEYYIGQIRMDRKMNDWLTLVGHLGFRRYFISDDLNPAGNDDGDVFTHYEIFMAGVFDPWKSSIFPVLEVAFTGDFGNYNSVLVVPEIIWAVNTHLELKAAVPFSVTTDGESIGVRVQAVARF
jgi:hypothetical protein